jgi:SAM-dependent methyltransferase
VTQYDLFARLYDLEHRDLKEDVELYHNFAARCDGKVLELGCGTGRVTLALAQAGFEVTGVDNSAAMLDLAQARAADAGLQAQVRLEQMDVRNLDQENRFALAIYALNGFLHLTTVADQLSALSNIHRALLPGGFLLVDLPNPHTVFTPAADGQLIVRRHFQSEQGHPITSLIGTQTDLANQIQRLTLFYDEVGQDGAVRRTAVEMDLRFAYRYEMAALLRQVGFDVDAVYGSYDLEPYEGDSPIMLFVAHTLLPGRSGISS